MTDQPRRVTRALLSVSDKSGLIEFARALSAHGVDLISTGGTAKAIAAAGLKVRDVSDLTGFPEMMDGRVKTLHPKVHGGLLAIRDNAEHAQAMKNHGIAPIDLLVVNLYPFEATVDKGADFDECIENIDIGGPAMIRAAAKNHDDVAVVVEATDYQAVLDELATNGGATTLTLRRRLAAKAYARTAAYECVAEFDPARTAACVIVKHANPCGVAEGSDLISAYRKAFACDTQSPYGGIIAVNRILDADTARVITEILTEVIIAPDATEEAIAIIAKRRNLRLLLAGSLPDPRASGLTAKTVAGGLLVQSRDNAVVDDISLKTVTKRAPTDAELRDLKFAFRVAKHVKSNTIVYAKDLATVGVGAGQMSRVDASRIAARKAQDAAADAKLAEPMTKGSVVASDAFFPFADGLLVAIEAGATAVIQPGGSIRDDEVIKAADDAGIAMVFTGVRHFRH